MTLKFKKSTIQNEKNSSFEKLKKVRLIKIQIKNSEIAKTQQDTLDDNYLQINVTSFKQSFFNLQGNYCLEN